MDERVRTRRIKRTKLIVGILLLIGFAIACVWPLITTAQTLETSGTRLYLEVASTTDVAMVASSTSASSKPPTPAQLVALTFSNAPVMLRVAKAESSFIPTAKNPDSSATGIFQILIGTWRAYGCTGSRTNAADNISCARKIYDAQGTTPWDSSKYKWGSIQ